MSALDVVKKHVARISHCNKDDVTLELELKNVKADSLAWLQIIVGIESSLGIEIDIEKMKEFVTIGDLVSYLDSCCAGK